MHVPVVTLSTEDDVLEQLKSGFKRTIKWNKYRLEMTNQTKTNHLNYLIDLTLQRSIDYSSYRSKIKNPEHLFQRIM